MQTPTRTLRHATSLRRLAACVAAAFYLHVPGALANVVHVTNCNDAGVGSLRAVVASTASGDTVDLSTLFCTISLQTGAIAITQDDLTFIGPGAGHVQINGKYKDRIFDHEGGGTLTVSDLSFAYGYISESVDNPVGGGCIYSRGNISLTRTTVASCKARNYHPSPLGLEPTARGGAIFAAGKLDMASSVVSASMVMAQAGANPSPGAGQARGGGIYAGGDTKITQSTISGNAAISTRIVSGGGLFARANAVISSSTISNNSSSGDGGGVYFAGYTPGSLASATVTDSTISGNTAAGTAGIYSLASVLLANSTVAFNKASSSSAYFGVGLHVSAQRGTTFVQLQSSIIANNTFGATQENDFGARSDVGISGAANLVGATNNGLPADTIIGRCPLLAPLHSNGGATQTHALLSRSPAINAGNNSQALQGDQRGAARVSGIATDMGAFEVQQADVVFNSNFDGCPAL